MFNRLAWFLGNILLAALLALASSCSSLAADPPSGPPATVVEATKVLDLATFPLIDGAEVPQRRALASLSYNAPGEVLKTFASQKKLLIDRGWKELPGGIATEQSSNSTLSRAGFFVSMMVFPSGKPGMVNLFWVQHGNVRLDKLPVPADAKVIFSGPTNTMYTTDSSIEATTAECKRLLSAEGWQPYGNPGDSLVWKQNAIRLTSRIAAAPAQGGKTMLAYTAELMSADLPAPAETIGLQYADITKELSFDSTTSREELATFYQTTLAKDQWKSTTDKLISIDTRFTMIFRNPAMDLLDLELFEIDGKQRVRLRHQSAAEVEAIEKRIREKLEKDKKK